MHLSAIVLAVMLLIAAPTKKRHSKSQ